ncbi:MAG: inosine/xanthosine triphosphatase [Thermosphaera sp.]
MGITLCIGSSNPVKIRGVREAFEKFFPIDMVRYKRVTTSVRIQPMNLDEIVRGARERALGVMDPSCDYGVGVEAGFYIYEGEPFDVEASYIIDKDGHCSLGFSPSFPVPKKVYEWIVEGRYVELEEAVEAITGINKIGEREGFIGFLSRGKLERYVLSYTATIMALVKLLNRELYELASKR